MDEKDVNERLRELRREDMIVKVVSIVIFLILAVLSAVIMTIGAIARAPMSIWGSPYYISVENIFIGNVLAIVGNALPVLNLLLSKVLYSMHGVSERKICIATLVLILLLFAYNVIDLINVIPTYSTATWQ
ncbi:MAG: hypothetical protein J5999_09610 [Oscillospiraceae bacterium]|nr:hypothetical protein [Oscillospiraceae bacterium]